MHTLHLVAVTGTRNTDGTLDIDSAREALSRLPDNDWWDWYAIGGRWDGYFKEFDLPGRPDLQDWNVLPVLGHLPAVEAVLKHTVARQDREFRSHRDHLIGAEVAVSDISGHVWGLPVADSQATADNLTRLHEQTARGWRRLLEADTLAEAAQANADSGMHLYHARRLVQLCNGSWNPDSGFHDPHQMTSHPGYLLDAVTAPTSDESRKWYPDLKDMMLVAVDFHF